MSSNTSGWHVVFLLIVMLAYWAPTIVALTRNVPNKGSVIVVDAFLGWTIIGWVVALAMAVRSKPPTGTPTRPAS